MTTKTYWNWQQHNWPKFEFDSTLMGTLEKDFLHNSGQLVGVFKHIDTVALNSLKIEFLSSEAVTTSEIEGEHLNRDSVQSSLRKKFGLSTDSRKVKPAEDGITELMVDLYQNFAQPLSHDLLFKWHQMLMKGRHDVESIGSYRTHTDPMVIASGAVYNPRIHFEAPPSHHVKKEMNHFVTWFNQTSPNGRNSLSPLIRAAITHLYFVCIHPFEDGNGRIARALAVKCLAQSRNQPSLLVLSETILSHRKKYYDELERNNKSMQITSWVQYFSETILNAQRRTIDITEFLIQKTKFFDRLKLSLNERQLKVLVRVFREGPNGFSGGLSAEKYIRITQTSRATATRDLANLVSIGALNKTGTGKGTRYQLKLS